MTRFFALGLIVLFLVAPAVPAPGAEPGDRIFPDSTKGFLSIRSLKELGEQWRSTQIGTLLNDPIMDAFKEDFRKQLDKRFADRFGLTLDAIQQLPSGEVAVGMIAIPTKIPGHVMLLDVADRLPETRDYLDRTTKKLLDAGVKRSVAKYKDQEIVTLAFPEPAQPTKSATAPKPAPAAPPDRLAHYMIKKDRLILSDQVHLVQLIADRLDDSSQKALADVEDYQVVMKRCRDDMPDDAGEPVIRWYIEPLNYGESVRTLLRGPLREKRRNKQSVFSILKEQGFDAIRGIGGVIGIKAEDKEVVYRFFIYAKKPYRLAMRMLVFPDSTNFSLPGWMPPDLARCSMFYVDPIAIFDNFGSLFDALVMQGETGVWADIIEGLKTDPNGPQIDIREEIIVHLGNRVLGMSKYQLPITPSSECIVIAVELKDGTEEAMNKALRKLFDNDSEMQESKHKSYILWHRVFSDDVIQPYTAPSGVPDLVSTPTTAPVPPPPAQADTADPMFPAGAITVAKGCLFVGTNLDYLKTILDRLETGGDTIAGHPEYKVVDRIFASMGLTEKPHFLQFFARTDETIRPTYELIRQGKMPQSQAILGKAINALLSSGDEDENPADRRQAIDGNTLPEFDKVRHYLGPAGLFGASEENGYFFKGFLLEKKAEEEIGPNRDVDVPKDADVPKPDAAAEKPEPEPPSSEGSVK